MADSPTLYTAGEHFHNCTGYCEERGHRDDKINYRPASPAEILSAARAHAVDEIDIHAGTKATFQVPGPGRYAVIPLDGGDSS